MAIQGSEHALPVHAPETAWRLPVLAGVIAGVLVAFGGAIVGPDLQGPLLALAGLLLASALTRQTILLRDLSRIEHGRVLLVEDLEGRITELDRVQAQDIAASRRDAVRELSAAVAHEVNNPLQVILGYAEILLDEVPAAGSPHEELEVIRSEALRARSIVLSLMESARSGPSDPPPIDPAKLDLEVPADPVESPMAVPNGV